MRKLAQAAQVEAMSLYNHVKNKDDLLDGMLEQVIGAFTLPRPGKRWMQQLRISAQSAHEQLLLHPWAAPMMMSRIRLGPASMAWSESVIACLHSAGFSYPMADHGWNAIENHIYGFTLQRIGTPVEPENYAAAAKQYLPMISAEQYPHIHAMASLIASGKHNGINDFQFGLDLILEGLQKRLGKP